LNAQAARTAQAGAEGDGQDVAAAGRCLRLDGLGDKDRPGDGRMASDGTTLALQQA
jgi:hypothetical protein